MKAIYDPAADPQFSEPYLDVDEERERKDPLGRFMFYRFIHGGFHGTNVKFSFCFPNKDQYQGRFYQHLSPFPGPNEELASLAATGEADFIAFSIAHGACFVSCNMGSTAIFGGSDDPTIFYRSNAAAAMQCRKTAQELFGSHRMYGYVFGGSGGGYKAMSCIENTNQYDGAVPFVIGSPMSLPNCLTVSAFGARRLRNCWQTILDNVEPGGSGNPYRGLNDGEKAALRELIQIGFPPRMILSYANPAADGSLPVLTPGVKAMDPGYFEDFWTKTGYEGYEKTDGVWEDLTDITARVISVGIGKEAARDGIDDRNGTDTAWQKMLTDGSASYIELTNVPASDYLVGIDIMIQSGDAAGRVLRLGGVENGKVIPGMTFGADSAEQVLSLLRPGDKVRLTNRDYIAIQHYHRHQVPEDLSFHAWDQYRDGRYAQRPVIAYQFTKGGCGSVQDGHIQGKVIVMNSLMDGDFPWQADWYVGKVKETVGKASEDLIRIWYNDNCPHGDVSEMDDQLHFTSYLGMLQQALLDVSAWAEKGVEPAPSTGYILSDQQVILEEKAERRQGTQPVVRLAVNGGKCAKIKAGETVILTAETDLTPFMGTVTGFAWSFEGEQSLAAGEAVIQHRYQTPGVYFPTVQVTAARFPDDPFCKLRNLDRVRVIVE